MRDAAVRFRRARGADSSAHQRAAATAAVTEPRDPGAARGDGAWGAAKDPAQRFQTMDELSRQLAGGGATSATPPTPRVPAADAGISATMPAASHTTLSASASIIERELTATRGRRRGPLVVAALAVAAVGGYVVFSRAHREPEPAAQPVVARPAAPAPAPVPPVAPPVAKAISTIVVKLTSDPAGARVVRERDGALVGVTPLKETWPSSSGSEKLRLDKDGYRSESLIVRLDLGVELAVPLRPVPAPPAHRHASSAHPAAASTPERQAVDAATGATGAHASRPREAGRPSEGAGSSLIGNLSPAGRCGDIASAGASGLS